MAILPLKNKIVYFIILIALLFGYWFYNINANLVDEAAQLNSSKPQKITTTTNKDLESIIGSGDSQSHTGVLNPNAPCPPNQFSCFATQFSTVADEKCPSYKPLWAYISKNQGTGWYQVGCYATEIDARKALEKALASNTIKPTNVATQDIPPEEALTPLPQPTSIQELFNQQANNTSSEQNNNKTKQLEPQNTEQKTETKNEKVTQEEHASEKTVTATEPNPIAEPKEALPEKSEKLETPINLTVQFKILFGLISVEKRTYPDEAMKLKAINMWNNGQHLLEPDGSVNDKYAVKNNGNNQMIGR